MVLSVILLSIVLLITWTLFAPIELLIDTRVPIVTIRWRTIGTVAVQFYDDEFWLSWRIFFIRRRWLMKNAESTRKKEPVPKNEKRRKNTLKNLRRAWHMIRTFKVKEYEVAFSPQDYCLAATLYPLNYLPVARLRNVCINFNGANYFVAKIVSAPWRMVYALIQK